MSIESKHIKPELLDTYMWSQTKKNGHKILFKIPEGFDVLSIKLTLEDDHRTIHFGCKNMLPFFEGTLFNEVTDVSEVILENEILLILHTEEKEKWPIIFNPDGKSLDPQSALRTYIQISEDEEKVKRKYPPECFEIFLNDIIKDMDKLKYKYFNFALECHLPIALCKFAMENFNTSDNEIVAQLKNYLNIAIEEYDDGLAHMLLGLFFVHVEGKISEGIPYLEKAAERGFVQAQESLGEIYSPYSENTKDFKDSEKSFKYYRMVLEKEEFNESVTEIVATMYEKGDGVEQNVKKAEELREKLKKYLMFKNYIHSLSNQNH